MCLLKPEAIENLLYVDREESNQLLDTDVYFNTLIALEDFVLNQEELLEQTQQYEITPVDLREKLIQSQQILGSLVYKLTGTPLDSLGLAYTSESLEENPLGILNKQLFLSQSLSDFISNEEVEEVNKGLFEKIGNFFKTIYGEYKGYRKKSERLINTLNKYKDHLELRKNIELSANNTLYTTDLVLDIGKNFTQFINQYQEVLKGKSSEIKLKTLSSFKYLDAEDPSAYPLGLRYFDLFGGKSLAAYCLDRQALKALSSNDTKKIKQDQLDYTEVPLSPVEELEVQGVEDVFYYVKKIDGNMKEHYSIVDKALNSNFVFLKKLTTLGTNVGVFGGSMILSAKAGTKAKNEFIKMMMHDPKTKFLSKQGIARNVVDFGVSYKVDDWIHSAVDKIPVNKLKKNIYALSKANMVWGDMYAAEKELVNMLRVKKQTDEKLIKTINKELFNRDPKDKK